MPKRVRRTSSRSDVQQFAEKLLIEEFSRQIGKELSEATIPIGQSRVTVDGYFKDSSVVVLVEAWSHVGKAKPAQRHKVLGDILKLALIANVVKRSCLDIKVESYLIFADELAATVVNGNTWASIAAKEFGIETIVIALSEEIIKEIKEAQRIQDIRLAEDTERNAS